MLSLPCVVRIYLHVEPVNLHLGFDRLANLVREDMGQDPLGGHLFVFRNRRGDEQVRALVMQFHDFKDSYEDMNFTTPYLSTIKARTLIMHGDRDKFFPVDIPVMMYTSIPHSYLWIVPNGGHTFLHDEPNASYAEGLLRFFKGEWEANNQPR